MYGTFAQVYDRLMRDVDYDAWAAHYRRLLAMAGVGDGARVVEAACGTGNLTVRLARHYEVSPRDLSGEMLSVAMGKARAAGLSLAFVREDMRAISAPRPADAVVCGCDAVNYLLSKGDLERFARSARAALRPGGALAFDVSSMAKLSGTLGNTTQFLTEDDVCYIWQNWWDARGRKLRMQVSAFAKRPDGCWDRVDEEQVQRAWEAEEIADALRAQGFARVRAFGGFGLRPPGANAQRLHFLAVRPES
ncbi:MAG TPA: class I SAM-dependent methyltransferase [Candidatus Limnocylindria bacterium]|nr:class I SAM-dependent methyltransferase [Candidatus Limnocylindria bacterium]